MGLSVSDGTHNKQQAGRGQEHPQSIAEAAEGGDGCRAQDRGRVYHSCLHQEWGGPSVSPLLRDLEPLR